MLLNRESSYVHPNARINVKQREMLSPRVDFSLEPTQ